MKRTLSILVVAALGLTACTDQPAPVEPEPTATVTETVTAEPTENLASAEEVAEIIARILEEPAPADIPVGEDAIANLEDAITLSADDHKCPIVADTVPEVAAYGAVSSPEDDSEAVTGLAAFGFNTGVDAAAFTENLQDVLEQCNAADYEIVPLTHHTDEALEIQVVAEESAASLVVLRNEHWVLTSVSTPPADIALSLTLVDQLDEMLR